MKNKKNLTCVIRTKIAQNAIKIYLELNKFCMYLFEVHCFILFTLLIIIKYKI